MVQKIVIFSANGGIGEAAAQELVKQLDKQANRGEGVEIHLLARAGEKGQNRAEGIAKEIRELEALHSRVDLRKVLHAHVWNEKDISSAEKALEDASVIILPGGVPRRDGMSRSDLIKVNIEMTKPMAEAIAAFAPVEAPVVTCTNPLDNITMFIEETCRKVWTEKGISESSWPEIKAIGMGGTLDESRYKTALADRLSDLTGTLVLPIDVEAVIYGQHGPNMAFDRDSIRVRGKTLGEFLNGQSGQIAEILDAAEKETKEKGAEIIGLIGRSSQEPPAARLAEIATALMFGKEPHTLTASVQHKLNGELRLIASGCQIKVSEGRVEMVPYTLGEGATLSENTRKGIVKSRATIAGEQAGYELGEMLPHYGDITKDSGTGKITIQDRQGTAGLEKISSLIDQALGLKDANKSQVADGELSFTADSTQLGNFATLARIPGFAQAERNKKGPTQKLLNFESWSRT